MADDRGNTGDLNTGDLNTGDLNTGTPCPTFFDHPCPNLSWEDAENLIPWVPISPTGIEWVETANMTDAEKADTANALHKTTGGFLRVRKRTTQECYAEAWPKLSIDVRRQFLALPHFDADKFLECVGVDVRLDRDLYPEEKDTPLAWEGIDNFLGYVPVKPVIIVIAGVEYELVPVKKDK